MKKLFYKLLLSLLGIICSQGIMAQDFIGHTEIKIIQSMHEYSANNEFINRTIVSPNETLLIFKQSKLDLATVYYLEGGVCKYYLIVVPRNELADMVKAINAEYIRQSNNIWVNKELTLKLTLTIKEIEVIVKYERI